MRFLVDIDDTINNQTHIWIKWLKDLYGLDIKYEDITSWDYLRTLGLTEEELFAPHNMKEFWDEVIIYPNAVDFLEWLVKHNHEVYLTTATYLLSDTSPYKFRKTLEPFNCALINANNIINTHDKFVIDGDILIDDKLENCELFEDNTILIEQPWNMKGRNNSFRYYIPSDTNDLNKRWFSLAMHLKEEFNL